MLAEDSKSQLTVAAAVQCIPTLLEGKQSSYSYTDKETEVQSWECISQGHPGGQLPS